MYEVKGHNRFGMYPAMNINASSPKAALVEYLYKNSISYSKITKITANLIYHLMIKTGKTKASELVDFAVYKIGDNSPLSGKMYLFEF